jgi:hypothetical protein
LVRQINRLSARTVETLSKPGRHADGGGLYLSISGEGRRRWVFMYVRNGKQREAGLGSAAKGGMSLKAVREKATEGRALLTAGLDNAMPRGGQRATSRSVDGPGVLSNYCG